MNSLEILLRTQFDTRCQNNKHKMKERTWQNDSRARLRFSYHLPESQSNVFLYLLSLSLSPSSHVLKWKSSVWFLKILRKQQRGEKMYKWIKCETKGSSY